MDFDMKRCWGMVMMKVMRAMRAHRARTTRSKEECLEKGLEACSPPERDTKKSLTFASFDSEVPERGEL